MDDLGEGGQAVGAAGCVAEAARSARHREGNGTIGLPRPWEGEVGDVRTAPGARAGAPAARILPSAARQFLKPHLGPEALRPPWASSG